MIHREAAKRTLGTTCLFPALNALHTELFMKPPPIFSIGSNHFFSIKISTFYDCIILITNQENTIKIPSGGIGSNEKPIFISGGDMKL